MNSIGGLLVTHNCLEYDYCFEAALDSLFPLCDEVVVSDSGSTDGTLERLYEIAEKQTKLRIVQYPWNPPVGAGHGWFIEWLNHSRKHLTTKYQMSLDADEVLHEDSYAEIFDAARIGVPLYMTRLNFWKDHRRIAPPGKIVGHWVLRFGRADLPTISDAPEGPAPIAEGAISSNCQIFHYGFIRRKEAFFAKSKVMQKAWFNDYDKRLVRAEQENISWHDLTLPESDLLPFSGTHPAAARTWLNDHGYL